MPASGEEPIPVRSTTSRSGCGCIVPAVAHMRRSDRCIRLQDQSLVAGNRAKTRAAVATGLWLVFSNLLSIECIQTAHRAVAPGMAESGLGATRSYLVKINFIPAIRRTVARKSEITRTARCLLPRFEPAIPPMIAAAARMRPREGIE